MHHVSHQQTGLCRHSDNDLEWAKNDAIMYWKTLYGTVHLLNENLKPIFKVDHAHPEGVDLS